MKLKQIIAASAVLVCATAAHAQSEGSFILNAGWTHIMPTKTTASFHAVDPNSNVQLKSQSASAFGLSGTYFMTDNLAAELALSTPTRLTLKAKGYNVASVKQFNPALLLKYYFFNAEDKFRPYVGAGVSRVSFSNLRLEKIATDRFAFDLKNKWAPVANAGFTYQFTEQLFGGVSVSYTPVEAGKITAKVNRQETIIGKYKFNPITTFVSLGYKF